MTVEDPVCRRQIEIDEVQASAKHEGWEYFFCSAACYRRFLLEPQVFASAPKSKKSQSPEMKAF